MFMMFALSLMVLGCVIIGSALSTQAKDRLNGWTMLGLFLCFVGSLFFLQTSGACFFTDRGALGIAGYGLLALVVVIGGSVLIKSFWEAALGRKKN